MTPIAKEMSIAAALLMVFCLAGAGAVSFTEISTKERIEENQRLALLDRLNQVLPEGSYDNELTKSVVVKIDPFYLGSKKPQTIFLATKKGQPSGAVITAIAPDGYSGEIQFIVGINTRQQITGVRVIAHKETPGLGDGIEIERSNWVLQFNGTSLSNPANKGWSVKKDGGEFDQLTGATITPRSMVKATKRVLEYSKDHFDEWFTELANEASDE